MIVTVYTSFLYGYDRSLHHSRLSTSKKIDDIADWVNPLFDMGASENGVYP